MRTAICTLFEGNYHFGVATLINSLSEQGFKGSIFVGFKGELADWCKMATNDPALNWHGATTLILNQDLKVHFLPVTVSSHLTNYKPDFMLELFHGPCLDMDRIAYFDPDIVVKCRWEFFETWMSHGVALVHEISSNDMPATHPIRLEWKKVAKLCGTEAKREVTSYINAGFYGVPRDCMEFLKLFRDVINVAKAKYHFNDSVFQFAIDRSDLFYAKDQDALNIAAMCCECPITEMGPEAMDFTNGGFTMSHAVGSPKPWAKKFILSALQGIPPSMADKMYWANVMGPIKTRSPLEIKLTLASINFAALVGRFYRRS